MGVGFVGLWFSVDDFSGFGHWAVLLLRKNAPSVPEAGRDREHRLRTCLGNSDVVPLRFAVAKDEPPRPSIISDVPFATLLQRNAMAL